MKRVLLTIVVTVVGLVALLSFKSAGHRTGGGVGLPAALPSAGLPSADGAGPSAVTGTSTSAPPRPPGGPATIPSPTAAAPAGQTVDGDAVQTRYGIVQIAVTLSGHRITNVSFLQLTADDERSAQINAEAAPTLLQETLAAQSAQIDSVSGASYTSDGYVQSLQSALDRAGFH